MTFERARPSRPAFVDAHVHLWDLASTQFALGWLEEPDHGILGPLGPIRFPMWDADRFRADAETAGVVATVAVPASDGGDGAVEVAWLQAEHERTGLPHVIVGRPDMRAGDIEAQLDALQAASPRLRGVRDMGLAGALDDPSVPRALRLLEQRGLSWDLHCFWEEMAEARRLAEQFPALDIVLGHAGFPLARDPDYYAQWRRGIRELARAGNVSCKISGLGMCDHEWDVDSWRPWLLHCIEEFDAGRCMFGSNWPVDRLYAPYEKVLDAFDTIVSDFTHDEREALFNRNAARFYRVGP